ncbi:hypothetical protein AAG570_002066, partial [Ranatra chinensis]
LLRGQQWADKLIGQPVLSPPGWRLRPALVSHLHGHTAPVTRLVTLPKAILASCSGDGCVRIWDCGKMESRNIANRARQVYNTHSGPLLGMTLCNNNTCLAMASRLGAIIVLKIEANKMSALDCRQLDLEEEGPPVDIAHFDPGSQSVLVYPTVYGYVIGWDLRAPGIAWKLENDLRQGVITAMHMDSRQCCLSLGTSSGFHTCWDLRFHLPIATIQHPSGSRVRRLTGHPTEPSWLISAAVGNDEVSLWDIESESRRTVLWGSSTPPLSHTQGNSHSVCALYSGIIDRTPFLLTGGTDHRVRYWDLDNLDSSYVAIPAGSDSPGQCTYSYNCRQIDGTHVVQEIQSRSQSGGGRRGPGSGEECPRAGPDQPATGHHNAITDITLCQATQCFMVTGARDGVIKVWK